MDLRGILNDGGASAAAAAAASPATAATPKQPRPQQQQQQLPHGQAPPPPQYQQQIAPAPSTPLQSKPSYGFNEYAHHPSQASPGKHPHQEYPPHPATQRQPSYHAQSPYQSPAPYPPRQAPPPLQASFSDARSPTSGPSPMAAPNPYGRTTTTPHGGAPQGSYFSGHHTPTELASPIQQHQSYPAYGGRDSFASQSQSSASVATGGPHGPYLQSPVLQTPSTPGAPGNAHPYPHQRSLSNHSANTATPTSAQSQHAPYGSAAAFHHQQQQQQQQQQHLLQQQQQRSPVVTGRPPVPLTRQQSQPPGPAAMPANTRQSSDMSAASFTHPSSPHSQRMPSTGPNVPQPQQPPLPPTQQNPTQHSQGPHASPPPPGPAPGMPNRTSSTYTSPIQHHSELRRTSTTRSERDRSVSISPKTHITSLPNNNPGQAIPPASPAGANPGPPTAQHAVALPARADRAMTPAKRKMDDRDTDEDPDRREVRQRQGDINGKTAPVTPGPPPKIKQEAGTTPGSRMSTSPVAQKHAIKPKRYAEPPPWARSAIGHKKFRHGNHVFPRPKPSAKPPSVNGRASSVLPKQEFKSRHPSPETARGQPLTQQQQAPPQAPAQPPAPPPDAHAEIASLLGPWEPTIANVKPLDEVNKAVADFLFVNVVCNPNAAEIAGLGIEFEVEAKLGIIIDRDTNERIALPVASECLLEDRGGRLGFRSSMTEAQHKGLNEYLNQMVILADPRNPNNAGSRVQITYKHRREEDYYFELPPHMQAAVPGCVRALLRPRQAPKARVTYDQRTKSVLAKIIKARVADLHLHMPGAPLDCRISVNLEMPWPGPVEELEQLRGSGPNSMPRQKDRLSYGQGNIQVDLTQVTLSGSGLGGPARSGKEHELEIELAPGVLLDQGERVKKREAHKYPELIECFVDNIRLLARKTREF